MDMQSIIKNSVGATITNKLTHETATISGVEDGEKGFIVYVSNNGNIEQLSFMQFVSKYNLEFRL